MTPNHRQCNVPPMDCPKCEGKLVEKTYGRVRVDRCVDCEGIWFDANEVRALVAHATRQKDDVPQTAAKGKSVLDDATGRCPHCVDTLDRVESLAVAGLHYDRCRTCRGAWLDAGEIDQIMADPDAGAMLAFFNEFD